jgi:hypothetical protein
MVGPLAACPGLPARLAVDIDKVGHLARQISRMMLTVWPTRGHIEAKVLWHVACIVNESEYATI